jgi:tetratricopeptide (TPR) repeat protein
MKSLPLLSILAAFMIFMGGCRERKIQKQETAQEQAAIDPVQTLTEKISKDTLDPALYHDRAKLLLDRRDPNAALGDLRHAIDLEPDNSDLYVTLADAYMQIGKLPSCLEALQKAEKLNPANNEALLKMAEVYLVLQDYTATYSYVKKALDLDTKNPRAYFIRGYALMETGDTASAVRNIQNALDQDQTYYEAAVQLGILYATAKNALAEQYFRTAIDIDPGRDAAYYLLGMFYQDNGRMEQAVEAYSRLLVVNPSFKEGYYNLGYINLVHYQDFKKAAGYFTQALQIDPKYLDAWFNRGYSYELAGDYQNARSDYLKAMQISPNYDRAVEGLNRLDKLEGK